jgi:hypothetical protein
VADAKNAQVCHLKSLLKEDANTAWAMVTKFGARVKTTLNLPGLVIIFGLVPTGPRWNLVGFSGLEWYAFTTQARGNERLYIAPDLPSLLLRDLKLITLSEW